MLYSDDELQSVDNVYLGPPGWTLPWEARFVAYGVGSLLTVFAIWVETKLHLHLSFWTIAWTALLIIAVTRKLGQLINFETPLRAVLVMFAHEISTPRRPPRYAAKARPGRVKIKSRTLVRVGAEPDETVEPDTNDPALTEDGPSAFRLPMDLDISAVCMAWLHECCKSTSCVCHCHEESA
jgi:hypothetical protein